MDLLKKELERKKKAVELAKQQQQQRGDGEERTFLKASELRRIQEEQEEELRRKRKRTTTDEDTACVDTKEVKAKTNQQASTEVAADDKNESVRSKDEDTPQAALLTEEQVLQQLRALGLPVCLFGEDLIARRTRLNTAAKEHASSKTNEMDEFRLSSGHGIRNPFLERNKKNDDEESKPKRRKEQDNDHVVDENDPHKRIYRFFKGLLRQWEDDLALRPEAVKRTAAGKNETKTLKQCKDYIRPLFKLCKTRKLEPSLMEFLLRIVQYCEEGEFVKAHDAYMDVAIGRAAWPIGVTMVGIHARTGRSKIESANVAHVMNSELQRKYLTSVKRLMTYCQNKAQDVAPSKKVMN